MSSSSVGRWEGGSARVWGRWVEQCAQTSQEDVHAGGFPSITAMPCDVRAFCCLGSWQRRQWWWWCCCCLVVDRRRWGSPHRQLILSRPNILLLCTLCVQYISTSTQQVVKVGLGSMSNPEFRPTSHGAHSGLCVSFVYSPKSLLACMGHPVSYVPCTVPRRQDSGLCDWRLTLLVPVLGSGSCRRFNVCRLSPREFGGGGGHVLALWQALPAYPAAIKHI